MATFAREVLTNDGMGVQIFCAGMSYVGIRVSGTWSGTIAFSGAQMEFGATGPVGGSSFKSVSVYDKDTAAVQALAGITGNGTFYWPCTSYSVFQAKFTKTSGNPLVTLAASIDSSYADAYLIPSNKFRNSTAVGQVNTLLIPADPIYGRRIRSLVVSAGLAILQNQSSSSSLSAVTSGWGSSPTLQILDGTTVLFAMDLPSTVPLNYEVPIPKPQTTQYGVTDGGIYCTPGSNMSVVLARPVGTVATNINAEVCAA